MTYKLLVFDWDGTLMDSEARIVSCLAMTLADLGLAPRARHELLNVIGLGLPEAVAVLVPGADPTLIERFIDRYRYHFLSDHYAPMALFPGVRETLDVLAARGYRLAVATGKGRRGLDRSLEDTGCLGLFHATRCADETASKPDPRMLRELMEALGCAPGQILMVGDTEYDLLMARTAGVHGVGVCCGVHTRERLLACEPLACLDRVPDLIDWLDRNTSPQHL